MEGFHPTPTASPAAALRAAASRLFSFLWIPLLASGMRWGAGWRIAEAGLRREYAERRAEQGPLLICANHLTLADSLLVAWALASAPTYLLRFSWLPWNVPESTHFARSRGSRALITLLKCIPITRGGRREEVARVLARIRQRMEQGEVVLLFPEGGRSRSGRVEVGTSGYGVGRLVRSLPGCRVLCVYLRGRSQEGFSDLPRRGERFDVRFECFEPKSDAAGFRASVDVSKQILGRLQSLERRHFDDRQ